tara:strand:- start:6283 stop:7854 length:1572 start_codon:yes stop_codon:yes gene_type:complete
MVNTKKAKVCILAAGTGSRSKIIDGLHKALLPVGNQSILSHLIGLFPPDTRFVVALGHKSHQIKSYLDSVYSDLDIEYVQIDNYQGKGSGPGHSLMCCEEKLQQPFIFMPVDNYLVEPVPLDFDTNWIGVSEINPKESKMYCLVSGEEELESFHYGTGTKIFNGISGICDYNQFWKSLSRDVLLNGEHQVINGFSDLDCVKILRYKNFFDVGNLKSYRGTLAKFPNDLVLEKTEECLFIDNGKVVKYFSDSAKCKNRILRIQHLDDTIPSITEINENMYCYDYAEGEVLSMINSITDLRAFLDFYKIHFMGPRNNKTELFLRDCKKMYMNKSYQRASFYEDTKIDKIEYINGIRVKPIKEILDQIKWDEIFEKAIPSRFHGDFQPENIIRNEDFILIDWRESFGDSITTGDIYYDLGKLYHGLVINGKLMLDSHYKMRYINKEAELSFLLKSNLVNLLFELKRFCCENNLCWKNVLLVGVLNYINIAPFYANDKNKNYSEFIFLLGKLLLSKHLFYGEDEILI